MVLRDIFAINLRKARKQAELSQEELAHLANVDRTYIGALERSVYSASLDMVEKLARVLDVSTVSLLTARQDEGKAIGSGKTKDLSR